MDVIHTPVSVLKVDESLGLVFGWAMISKIDGTDYVDTQGDHIPEAVMLSAAAEFMQGARIAKEMHSGAAAGSVVFAFPMTTDIAKSLDISTRTTGLLIAMKPNDESILEKYRSGYYSGFSIGGVGAREEIAV